ncbi:MAG TPA: SRPBCC domain-containing protein [Actinomycetota bacterium]|nr:SRPBCC domain-containing protein [Actinomycetota bacterium]
MQVEKRIVLAADPAEAWAVVLDFASWFSDGIDAGEIRPGARAEFAWGSVRRAAVFEDVESPRYLAFRWLPFARLEDGETVARPQARVEITLSPTEEGVEIVVVERRMDGALTGATA